MRNLSSKQKMLSTCAPLPPGRLDISAHLSTLNIITRRPGEGQGHMTFISPPSAHHHHYVSVAAPLTLDTSITVRDGAEWCAVVRGGAGPVKRRWSPVWTRTVRLS
ncbi:hypothetical protein RRG08_046010 [Elysia crispata]|uniref:Uncharacterized protein n=1 Tax=Elysia crispata TaxID=231223 RepID=A0AAE0ZCE5_9GAST|nr:hypothetical protein RRG08_046010 [Elysia crispata]